jgi:hypothetical protein
VEGEAPDPLRARVAGVGLARWRAHVAAAAGVGALALAGAAGAA